MSAGPFKSDIPPAWHTRITAVTDALHDCQVERDGLASRLARTEGELAAARAQLAKLASWEPLNQDAEDVVIVGTEGAYEFPWWAVFADRFRAEQYIDYLATHETPEDETGEYSYTVELVQCDGRLSADGVALWNNGADEKVLPEDGEK